MKAHKKSSQKSLRHKEDFGGHFFIRLLIVILCMAGVGVLYAQNTDMLKYLWSED